jgi:hypothetical protein
MKSKLAQHSGFEEKNIELPMIGAFGGVCIFVIFGAPDRFPSYVFVCHGKRAPHLYGRHIHHGEVNKYDTRAR